MKEYISSFILYCLLFQFVTPSFFNFGYFCQTKPNKQYSGSFIYGNQQSSPEYFNIKPNKNQQFNQPKQFNNILIPNIFQPIFFQNQSPKQNFHMEPWKTNKQIQSDNEKLKMFPIKPYISIDKLKEIQQSQKQGLRALLKVVNITQQKLQYYYIYNIIQQANKLDQVLIYRVRPLRQLPDILITLKLVILNLIEHQLGDVNSVIIGEKNKVIGHKIFLKGNNLHVNANESFILDSKSKKKTINGNNILRIRNYQIYLNEVEDVQQSIDACIVYLPQKRI